jgi:hypothetical protein
MAKGGGAGGGGGGRTPREALREDAGGAGSTEAQVYEESPSQMAQAAKNLEMFGSDSPANMERLERLYDDIPAVENANRRIVDGEVIVGSKGAPTTKPTMSLDEAYEILSDRGVPPDVTGTLGSRGAAGVRHLADLLSQRPDAKFLGRGVEGMAISWGKSNVLRVQYGGGKPLPTDYIGKMGAYPKWMKQYGGKNGVWVEMKERIWKTASELGRGRTPIDRAYERAGGGLSRSALDYLVNRATKGRVGPADAHSGNWGIDFKGRLRAIDPGAYTKPDKVPVAIWK